ncbi:SDR family oxidoreductase [Asticcacaulis sp. EMRT-3]|uniref:SDR family oxidoreductase n=1 Tax=Asticcacaulis sp. EMRT-3 TaxID=3040349 RepID=UPI0024AF0778|nr:SDR family oxidoreductase [Asticcacaulis sp. EMRT-3]MDI7775156.1 SDR family oxidoreductase [Asticcacaulis sp. EMRT-3]
MTPSLFDLTGRTALVTGSSQGIGQAIAAALAGAGARIILNGRDEARLEAAAITLRQTGADVMTALFDVTDPAAVAKAVNDLEDGGTTIEILVNNAGIQRRCPLEDFTLDDWQDIMRSNLDSVFYVGQAVARHMIKRGHGKIINIASVQSELARPTIAPYTASKGAVKNLTRGMCADWARHGLQINAIGPGYFATPLNRPLYEDAEFDGWLKKRTPAARWGKLEDLHGAAIFLASSASDFINGQILYVDGGLTVSV